MMDDLWQAMLDPVKAAAMRPEYAAGYWFQELGTTLNEAEAFAKDGARHDTARKLRELQARCERLIGTLVSEQRGRPHLVAAA
jgi:hypothetical protein